MSADGHQPLIHDGFGWFDVNVDITNVQSWEVNDVSMMMNVVHKWGECNQTSTILVDHFVKKGVLLACWFAIILKANCGKSVN